MKNSMMKKVITFASFVLLMSVQSVSAVSSFFEGFEDPTWVADPLVPGNWQNFGGTITRATSGTGGILSATGVAHATTAGGAFNRLGGYSSDFGVGYIASLDVYLDPAAIALGKGFDYSVASSNQTTPVPAHLRDFIFHVGKTDVGLLINASNNTDGGFNDFKLKNDNSGVNVKITTAGWYRLQHAFEDAAGSLAPAHLQSR